MTGPNNRTHPSTASASSNVQQSHEANVRSDMASTMSRPGDTGNNGETPSLPVRCGKRWRVKPPTASWMLYSRERGLIARVVGGMDELGAVKAALWIKPILEHLKAMQEREESVTLRLALELDSAGDVAVNRFLTDDDGDRSDTRDEAILAVERKAAAWNCQAALWRAEREAEREREAGQ